MSSDPDKRTTSTTVVHTRSENPLRGTTGVVLFVLMVLLSLGVAFIVCARAAQAHYNLRDLVIQLYLLVVIVGWFCFVAASDREEFLLALVFLGPLCGIQFALVLSPKPIFFWLSLSIAVGFVIAVVLANLETKDNSERFLASAYAGWLTAGLVITLGRSRFLPFSAPAWSITEIHYLMDLRYLISGFALFVFTGKAIAEAFDEGTPNIPPLPEIVLSGRSATSEFDISRPFVIVINAILFVVQKTTGAIWQVGATVATYLYRTGRNLANLVLDVVLNGAIWVSILKVIFTFVTFILMALLTKWVLPRLVSYLESHTSPLEISRRNILSFGVFALVFMVVLSLIASVCRVWKLSVIPLTKAAFPATMLMLIWAVSGAAMYALGSFEFLVLHGFTSVGTYTVLFLLVVVAVFVIQVVDRLSFREDPRPSEAQGLGQRRPHLGYGSAVWILVILILSLGTVMAMRWSAKSDPFVKEFYVIYEGTGRDDVTRGRHDWKRTDADTWIERFPRGEERKMVVIRRSNLKDGIGTGVLLQMSEQPTWRFFIPDKGSQSMKVLMSVDNKPWTVLGNMLDVQ